MTRFRGLEFRLFPLGVFLLQAVLGVGGLYGFWGLWVGGFGFGL